MQQSEKVERLRKMESALERLKEKEQQARTPPGPQDSRAAAAGLAAAPSAEGAAAGMPRAAPSVSMAASAPRIAGATGKQPKQQQPPSAVRKRRIGVGSEDAAPSTAGTRIAAGTAAAAAAETVAGGGDSVISMPARHHPGSEAHAMQIAPPAPHVPLLPLDSMAGWAAHGPNSDLVTQLWASCSVSLRLLLRGSSPVSSTAPGDHILAPGPASAPAPAPAPAVDYVVPVPSALLLRSQILQASQAPDPLAQRLLAVFPMQLHAVALGVAGPLSLLDCLGEWLASAAVQAHTLDGVLGRSSVQLAGAGLWVIDELLSQSKECGEAAAASVLGNSSGSGVSIGRGSGGLRQQPQHAERPALLSSLPNLMLSSRVGVGSGAPALVSASPSVPMPTLKSSVQLRCCEAVRRHPEAFSGCGEGVLGIVLAATALLRRADERGGALGGALAVTEALVAAVPSLGGGRGGSEGGRRDPGAALLPVLLTGAMRSFLALGSGPQRLRALCLLRSLLAHDDVCRALEASLAPPPASGGVGGGEEEGVQEGVGELGGPSGRGSIDGTDMVSGGVLWREGWGSSPGW
jgi:hypothetical protein